MSIVSQLLSHRGMTKDCGVGTYSGGYEPAESANSSAFAKATADTVAPAVLAWHTRDDLRVARNRYRYPKT